MDNPGYSYAPAGNIERTWYGTTQIRVADDRNPRPQMMMPFIQNQQGGMNAGGREALYGNNQAFKFHTVRATRLGFPVAITIEPPPVYSQANPGFVIESSPQPQNGTGINYSQASVFQPQSVLMPSMPTTQSYSVGTGQPILNMLGQQSYMPYHQAFQPQMQPIFNYNQQMMMGGNCAPISIYRPPQGRMPSYDGTAPVEVYAPRSFAENEDNDDDDEEVVEKKQKKKTKKPSKKDKKSKKQREKMIIAAKVEKAKPPKQSDKKVRRSNSRRNSTSSESSSNSSERSRSDSESSGDERSDRRSSSRRSSRRDSKYDVEKGPSPGKKYKKAPKVDTCLYCAIAGFFFNVLFGAVAIVLSLSSRNSKRQRRFRQARWEGVWAAVTSTIGIIVSAAVALIILLYIYTNLLCNDCNR